MTIEGYITNTRGSYLHMGLGLNKSLVVYNTFILGETLKLHIAIMSYLSDIMHLRTKVKVYSITTKIMMGYSRMALNIPNISLMTHTRFLPNADDEPVNLLTDDPRWIDNTDFDYVMPNQTIQVLHLVLLIITLHLPVVLLEDWILEVFTKMKT